MSPLRILAFIPTRHAHRATRVPERPEDWMSEDLKVVYRSRVPLEAEPPVSAVRAPREQSVPARGRARLGFSRP